MIRKGKKKGRTDTEKEMKEKNCEGSRKEKRDSKEESESKEEEGNRRMRGRGSGRRCEKET